MGMPGEQEFEPYRRHLTGVAYRMLGSVAEAEDAVQEAWLRFAAADRSQIREPRAWLTTTTARICLDTLRSARVRREAYPGPWLPEPVVTRLGPAAADPAAADPGEQASRREQVSYALLVVMDRLTPEQRVAFVLHDVFSVPFDEIASVLGTTGVNARQLASRARRAVADGQARHSGNRAEQRRVLAAFLAAAEEGDLDGLLAVLAPDVAATGDGGGLLPAGRHPVEGPDRVARLMVVLFRRLAEAERGVAEPVLVNGDHGLLVEVSDRQWGTVRVVMAFAIADGRVTAVYDQLNPAKLQAVPAPDQHRAEDRV
ncbi:MAG TPA: RNA polymerase sigma factor SigJ [Micromonosporaceae bacterium]|nr:RNA polymerase sigma factor SigJ [Micromonosporaceae bacterium]